MPNALSPWAGKSIRCISRYFFAHIDNGSRAIMYISHRWCIAMFSFPRTRPAGFFWRPLPALDLMYRRVWGLPFAICMRDGLASSNRWILHSMHFEDVVKRDQCFVAKAVNWIPNWWANDFLALHADKQTKEQFRIRSLICLRSSKWLQAMGRMNRQEEH